MSSDWRSLALGALGEFRNGVNFAREQEGNGLPVLKVKDFGSSYFVPTDGLDELDSRAIEVPDSQMLAPGDAVLIRSNGNPSLVGRCLHVAKLHRPTTFSGFCIRFRPNPERVNPRFAAYVLRSPASRARFYSHGAGTGIQNLSQSVLSALPVLLPPRPEQDSITNLLGALDDKIDLNRRMNQTLEAMAQALFRSWFVDFDPVRAKAEGRQPDGMDAETAALFPARLVGSALGPLPEGWTPSQLDEVLVLQRGFDLPSSTRTPGPYPVVLASGLAAGHSEFKVKGPGVVTGRSGVLGNVFFVHEDFWPLNTTLWVKEFRRARPHFAYFLLKTFDFRQFNAGSAVPTLNRNHIHSLGVIVPPPACMNMFEEIVAPIFKLVRQNDIENDTLGRLRDELLPRLLSGELRIRDAEREVAASL